MLMVEGHLDFYENDKEPVNPMNAEAFRYPFEYHFTQNRHTWEECVMPLSHAQFTHNVNYSHGSVRAQVLHLMDVEEVWFGELRGVSPSEPHPAAGTDDRRAIRTRWDHVEQEMRAYLAHLRDEMLFSRPITEPEEDKDLVTWQVLLHVVNHATDHRAQLLRLVNDLGIKTTSQDLIFYVYDHPFV